MSLQRPQWEYLHLTPRKNSKSKSTFEVLLCLMENFPFWDQKMVIKMSVPAHIPKCVGNTVSRIYFYFSKVCVGSHNNVSFLTLCLLFIGMDHHWSVFTKISYSEEQELPPPPLHCLKSLLSLVTLREETYGKKGNQIFWTITSAVAPVRISEPQTESEEAIGRLGWFVYDIHTNVSSSSSFKMFLEY